ncbi:hypothetical protein [Pseudomonas sp. C11]|uniref:hypothetical protein n=1 Tax=Pseudomonas sp. C11 TaxID=3075550 RepID=UPI002AFEE99E|nr:hypothetical protein [Pseudomonas sp. C11]
MIARQMLLEYIPGNSLPDAYIEAQDGEIHYPDQNFVISRDEHGNTVSTFGELEWKLSTYSRNLKETTSIFFHTLGFYRNKSLQIQVKWLVFILMFFHHGRRGNGLAISTLVNYSLLLNRLSAYADENSLSLYDFFTNQELLINFGKTLGTSERRRWLSLARFYYTLPSSACGFRCINARRLPSARLSNASDKWWPDQTEVIPQRIYLATLDYLNERIVEFIDNLENLRDLLIALSEDITYGRSKTQQRLYGNKAGTYQPTFPEATKNFGLNDFFDKHGINDVTQLSHYLSTIQFTCKSMIHAYSGMRDGEVYLLQFDYLETKKLKGKKTLRLIGYTTKLSDTKKETYWVTSPEIELPVRAAQYICQLVSIHTGVPAENTYLFPSLSHLNFSNANTRIDRNEILVANLKNAVFNYIFKKDERFRITAQDRAQLHKIDFTRRWERDHSFDEGQFWPFASHQFRRSLAVYALSSKLVSLTSLKRQLQHISLAMTLYYLKGNLAEQNLFGDAPDHFINEVKHSYAIVAGLDYLEVVLSDEKLYGVRGQQIEKQIKPLGKKKILDSRKETVRRFQNGELSYRPTHAGGCSNPEPCAKVLHQPLTSCINKCHHAILLEGSLQAARKHQIKLVSNLEPGHERNTELLELEHLENYMKKNGMALEND